MPALAATSTSQKSLEIIITFVYIKIFKSTFFPSLNRKRCLAALQKRRLYKMCRGRSRLEKVTQKLTSYLMNERLKGGMRRAESEFQSGPGQLAATSPVKSV